MNRTEAFNLAFEGLQARIADWKSQFKRVYLVALKGISSPERIRDIPFVVRHPERAELSRMMKESGKDPLGAVNNLMFDITLHPDRAALGRLTEDMPALMIELQDALKDQIGLGLDFSAQEL